MSELSERDLALLSTIIYCDTFLERDGANLQTVVAEMLKYTPAQWDNVDMCGEFDDITKNVGRDAAVKRFKAVLVEIQKSVGLEDIKITSPMHDTSKTGITAACFVDADNSATVVFRGTDGTYKAWMDNFEGAGNDSHGYTPMQKTVLEYIEKLSERYRDITVTGHSKGGNLAAFAAIMCNEVSRCISFDGQGFSERFRRLYGDKIEANRGKIKTIASYNDFVNILMGSVSGETIFVENNLSITGKFTEAHYMSNIIFDNTNTFDEDGNIISSREQDERMAALKSTLDIILAFIPEDYEEWFTDTFLCLAALFLGETSFEDIVDAASRLIRGAMEHPVLFCTIVIAVVSVILIAAAVFIVYTAVKLIIDGVFVVLNALLEVAKGIGEWAVSVAATIWEAASNFINGIANWVKCRLYPGRKYTDNNPYFKADTAKLREYAARVQQVNARLKALDSALNEVFWQVSLEDKARLLAIDIVTSASPTLREVVAYLSNTADQLDETERKVAGYLGV